MLFHFASFDAPSAQTVLFVILMLGSIKRKVRLYCSFSLCVTAWTPLVYGKRRISLTCTYLVFYTNTRQVEAYSHYTPINHFAKVSKFHTDWEYGEIRFSKYVRQQSLFRQYDTAKVTKNVETKE